MTAKQQEMMTKDFTIFLRSIELLKDMISNPHLQFQWDRLLGFLPVIPGPCGLYRWNVMQKCDDVAINEETGVPKDKKNSLHLVTILILLMAH